MPRLSYVLPLEFCFDGLKIALNTWGSQRPPGFQRALSPRMSLGPFSLRVIVCFVDPVLVTISVSLTHANALLHNLCKLNPHIYPELCLFVVLQTYPPEILLIHSTGVHRALGMTLMRSKWLTPCPRDRRVDRGKQINVCIQLFLQARKTYKDHFSLPPFFDALKVSWRASVMGCLTLCGIPSKSHPVSVHPQLRGNSDPPGEPSIFGWLSPFLMPTCKSSFL